MKYILSLLLILAFAYSKAELISYNNGDPIASYSNKEFVGWEESAIFDANGSCYVNKIAIYFTGDHPAKDTIFITGSPFDFPYAVSGFAWNMAQIADPIYFDYPGEHGWYQFDISDNPIYLGTLNYLVLQHKIKKQGPYFAIDSDSLDHYMSLLCNVEKPNPNFYDIKGSLFYEPEGDYLAWIDVEYVRYPGNVITQPYPPQLFYNDLDSSRLRYASFNRSQFTSVSVADWNGDGFDDVSFGSVHAQNNGDKTFFNVNDRLPIRATGTVWADYNNDGLLDCYAQANQGKGHDQLLYQNPDGSFFDQTGDEFRVDNPSVTPLFLDYDKDGFLDIFIAYGARVYKNEYLFFPDRLYKNLGNGSFRNVTDESGLSSLDPPPHYYCGTASITDFNNDNSPDIFVANRLRGPDRLYKNNSDGTFSDLASLTGVIGLPTAAAGSFGNGRGSDWGDFNNDGYVDLAVGNMARPDERGSYSNPSLLFSNYGPPDYSFRDVQKEKNLNYYEENSGLVWLDFNQDGYLDICHTNYSNNLRYESVNRLSRLYLNQGPENNFVLKDVSEYFGNNIHGASSVVRLDYDWDGDMDILIVSDKDGSKLYRNDYPWKGNWISFRLKGDPDNGVNAQGYGSTVIVKTKENEYRKYLPGTIISSSSSQSTDELHFGLNNADSVLQVDVTFSNGKTFSYDSLNINRKYILHYGDSIEPMKITSPQQLSPIKSQVECKANIKLDWLDVGGTESYHLQIAGDYAFDHIILNETDINESHYIPEDEGLPMNNWYYWRVKSINEHEESNWSSIWHFNVDRPARIAGVPAVSELKAFPNPVSNISNIDFTVDTYSHIKLILYDTKGSQIAKMIDNSFVPGKYTFSFSTEKLKSGTYFYILHNGKEISSEKIIIAK